MTYTLVQHTGIQGTSLATSIGKAFASNVAAGNLLVASGSCFGAGLTITDTSDTLATPYNGVFFPVRNSNVTVAQFYATARAPGSCTVTMSGVGSDNRSLSIMEFNDSAGGAWSLDSQAVLATTSATPAVGTSLTPTQGIPAVIVGAAARDSGSGDTIAASAGWTTDEAFGSGANCVLGTEHQLPSSTSGAYQASFVVSGVSLTNVVGIAVYATPTGPAAVPQSASPMQFPHLPMRTA